MLPLVLFVSVLMSSAFGQDTKIIGGQNASIEDYPYTISLFSFGIHFCSGAIIDQIFAVTTAECVIHYTPIYVRANSSNPWEGGETYLIDYDKIYIHPKFDMFTLEYNLAVLQLDPNSTFPEGWIVGLADATTDIRPGTEGVVTGWGGTHVNNTAEISEPLQAVLVPTISQDDCRNIIGTISDDMICVLSQEENQNLCGFKDSGDPLVIDDELVGLATSIDIDGCGEENAPSVFVRISEVRDFIDSVVNDGQ